MHKLDDDERDMWRDLAREMHLRVLRWDGERGEELHIMVTSYTMHISLIYMHTFTTVSPLA